MQDSLAYESYPTHPLGARESWPASGPVYDVPEVETRPGPPRTLWQRIVASATAAPEELNDPPAQSPIWY